MGFRGFPARYLRSRIVILAGSLAFLAACDGGPRVACMGDSNTDARWQLNRYPDMGFPEHDGWCERLANSGIESFNWGRSRATLLSYPFQPTDSLRGANGQQQLDRIIEQGEADSVIISLGTNDLIGSVSPMWLIVGLTTLISQAESQGLTVHLTTVPFSDPSDPHETFDSHVSEYNQLLWDVFPDRVIDFAGVTTEVADYLDLVHVGGAIHREWSLEAANKVWSHRLSAWLH